MNLCSCLFVEWKNKPRELVLRTSLLRRYFFYLKEKGKVWLYRILAALLIDLKTTVVLLVVLVFFMCVLRTSATPPV